MCVEHRAHRTQALDVFSGALADHPPDSLVALKGYEHASAGRRSAVGFDLIGERAVNR
jgi:hypothetical protein